MKAQNFAFWAGFFILALYLLAFPRYVAPSPLLASYAWVDNLIRVGADQPTILDWTQQETQLLNLANSGSTAFATIFSWPASFWLIPGFWLAHQFPDLNFNAVQLAWLGQGVIAGLFAALLIMMMAWCHRRQFVFWQRVTGGIIFYLALMPFMQTLLMGENPIWLRPVTFGFPLRVHLLLPSLIILLMLAIMIGSELTDKMKGGLFTRNTFRVVISITIIILLQILVGAGHEIKSTEQARADLNLLQTLTNQATPNDALIILSPDRETAQIQTNLMLAYHRLAMPTYIWLESDTILTTHWSGLQRNHNRIWLYETDLRQTDPLGSSAALLAQNGFPQQTIWLDGGGRLSAFTLPEQPGNATPLNIPFEADLTLIDFAITTATPTVNKPLQVQLTWHLGENAPFPTHQPPLIGFVHLLNDQQMGQTIAQSDRVLVDYINHHQSPLLPGQTARQGYLLQPMDEIPAGAYSLIVGLYPRDTGQRLQRADDNPDDFVYLTTLQFTTE